MDRVDPQKILFVISSLELGGAERQMLMLISGLLEHGIKCEVAPLEGRGPLLDELEALGVSVHDLGYRRQGLALAGLARLLRAFFRLRALCVRNRFDIVQAYLPLPNFLAALAARLAGVRTVITCRRALGRHQDRHPFWPVFDRAANAMSTVVTVNSAAVGADVARRDGIDPAKLVCIHNGLDVTRFDQQAARGGVIRARLAPGGKELEGKGLGGNELACLSVGNLIPYKGYEDLIEAIALLPPACDHLRFFIAGEDRGQLDLLESRIRQRGLRDGRIIFLGRREDVPGLMAGLDMFVMPSHGEGFSNALLEALAAGMPVIATDVGGNREALKDGAFGVLVPPHDPPALAAALAQMAAGLGRAREKGQAAAHFVRSHYGAAAMVGHYLALYRQCHKGK